jgi:aspartate/methionine/tyrosine aminotransferase
MLISWVRPRSGTTALLRYDLDRSARQFCVDLLEHEGVLLTPGSAMDTEGYLRIGYAGDRQELIDGLPKISAYLHS